MVNNVTILMDYNRDVCVCGVCVCDVCVCVMCVCVCTSAVPLEI